MPRVDFKLWDRIYILKLICTVQMTFSSFLSILYFYLVVLQYWTSLPDKRPNIVVYKWSVIAISMVEFCLGTLLAVASNMFGIRRKRLIVTWIILETVLVPTGIFLLMRLYHLIKGSNTYLQTDPHFIRICIAQTCFYACHFFFIMYAVDLMVSKKPKIKLYDPSIRPETVQEPTYPQITTTESRHIRMCQSFLQPTTRKSSESNGAIDNEKAGTSGQN